MVFPERFDVRTDPGGDISLDRGYGGGAHKGIDGLGNGTVTTAAQFAHSLHSSNYTFFSVFHGVKITKNLYSFSKYMSKHAQLFK